MHVHNLSKITQIKDQRAFSWVACKIILPLPSLHISRLSPYMCIGMRERRYRRENQLNILCNLYGVWKSHHSLFFFYPPLALKRMIRHACPHQQVLCSPVELDLAADHVVRGACWNRLGHSNPNHCHHGGSKLLSLSRLWANGLICVT